MQTNFEVMCDALRSTVAAIGGVDRLTMTRTSLARFEAMSGDNDELRFGQKDVHTLLVVERKLLGVSVFEDEALPDDWILLQSGKRVVGAIDARQNRRYHVDDKSFFDHDGRFRPVFTVKEI